MAVSDAGYWWLGGSRARGAGAPGTGAGASGGLEVSVGSIFTSAPPRRMGHGESVEVCVIVKLVGMNDQFTAVTELPKEKNYRESTS